MVPIPDRLVHHDQPVQFKLGQFHLSSRHELLQVPKPSCLFGLTGALAIAFTLAAPTNGQTVPALDIPDEPSGAVDLNPVLIPSAVETLVEAPQLPLADAPPPSEASQSFADLAQADPTDDSVDVEESDETEIDETEVEGKDTGFSPYIGNQLPRPTTLKGATRPAPVSPASTRRTGGFSIPGGLQYRLDADQTLTLEVRAGVNILGADLNYTHTFDSPREGISVNFSNQRSFSPAFQEGELDVDLANGEAPFVHRLGGGAEVFFPVGSTVDAAVGVNYQRVSVRDDLFSNDLFAVDALNNPVTITNDGQDDLLTFNVFAEHDTRDSSVLPTTGNRIKVGLDQAIPVGDADLDFTRISASASQFIPVPLFGFSEGPRTLVLNVQGGHLFGDIPPYEAFGLGGSSSVRGYSKGEVGSSRSFIQATAEYRFPIDSFRAFKSDVNLRGLFFVDYATSLGTQDEVIGQPGIVRDKDGEGVGYGLGIHAVTGLGNLRFELGFDEDGDSKFYFSLGQRF